MLHCCACSFKLSPLMALGGKHVSKPLTSRCSWLTMTGHVAAATAAYTTETLAGLLLLRGFVTHSTVECVPTYKLALLFV